MESDGKSVTKDGTRVDYQTGVSVVVQFVISRCRSIAKSTFLANYLGTKRYQWSTCLLPAHPPRNEVDSMVSRKHCVSTPR